MEDETGNANLRDRLARSGEDALGKLAQDLLENPLVTGAIAEAFDAREKRARGAGDRDERAQPPVGRRPGAAHPPAALRLPAPRGHRGRRRPARPPLRGGRQDGRSRPRTGSAAIESQLAKLAADVPRSPRGSTPAPAPKPREQERLEVDEPRPPEAVAGEEVARPEHVNAGQLTPRRSR